MWSAEKWHHHSPLRSSAWICFISVTMGTGHSQRMGKDPQSPKTKTPPDCVPNMADEEGFSWVFESLVGFLKGPVWEAAVLTFIEAKSVVFDPVEGDEDEYRNIHDEYKNLVDTMLGSHMEDFGITPEDFETACVETEKNIHSQFRKSLFEQLWAADDYEIFKRMMTQKNLELQLQALDLLAYQYGIPAESFLPSDDYEPSTEEKNIMETVIQRYVEENPEETDEEQQTEQKEVIQATKAQLQAERQTEKKLMEKGVLNTCAVHTLHNESQTRKGSPTRESRRLHFGDYQAMETSLHDAPKADYENTLEMAKMTEVSQEEARRRQEYLKQQRDKLLALKKQEREKLLQRYEATGRPRSARAAKRMVTEEKADESVDPKVLAFRKSLAARLKAEVVDKKY